MTIGNFLLVGAGGFLGSIARYATVVAFDSKLHSYVPYGTLTVNLVGSFILGLVYGFTAQKAGDIQSLRLLLITGFCGGFTTFSAFAFENLNLLQQKMALQSFLYIAASLIGGALCVFAGIWASKL